MFYCANGQVHFFNTFKIELTTCLRNTLIKCIMFASSIYRGNAQNMKPVLICTGFIFCAIYTVVYL